MPFAANVAKLKHVGKTGGTPVYRSPIPIGGTTYVSVSGFLRASHYRGIMKKRLSTASDAAQDDSPALLVLAPRHTGRCAGRGAVSAGPLDADANYIREMEAVFNGDRKPNDPWGGWAERNGFPVDAFGSALWEAFLA